jgi:murein DD-endopeptidase MepM/ murein hydrolase activator NlpD
MLESNGRTLRSTPAMDFSRQGVRTRPKHRNLGEGLAAAGVRLPTRLAKARGLLHRWFRKESALLTVINTALSLLLFVLALTMTYLGMRIAHAFGLVVTLNESANAISPYAGVALLSLGSLRFMQNVVLRADGRVGRFLGLVEASLLIFGGIWAECVAWYTGSIPDILKPQLALAGGAVTANIIFFSTVVVPLFKPVLAAGLGGLLTAKQIKTTAVSGGSRPRWYMALIGLLASASALVIGMDAGQRYLVGRSDPHELALAGNADLWAKDFAPPFATGTWCRVSDIFGPRINPFYFIKPKLAQAALGGGTPVASKPVPATPAPAVPRIENHPGVDVAAREGTPVHAMVNGEVIYAGFHPGFGNMVVLQTEGSNATTLINGHMQTLFVEPGEMVTRGDLIGLVGSTGHSTGPHLHIQVCPDGHLHKGGFVCGVPMNPYEDWQALSAIARLACKHGPVGS